MDCTEPGPHRCQSPFPHQAAFSVWRPGQITELTRPGWQISAETIEAMTTAVTETAAVADWDTTAVILQLFDNSMYMVGGPWDQKKLPSRDRHGVYHIDGSLAVADKAGS
jgi:hypothetical protein